MAYNTVTWNLSGKRKLKNLLAHGSMKDLISFINEVDDNDNYSIVESMRSILKKRGLYSSDFNRLFNEDGSFKKDDSLLVSISVQEYLTSRGIFWENFYTEEELEKARNFKDFLNSLSSRDRRFIDELSFHYLELSEIFDENNEVNPGFFDALLRYNYGHMENICFKNGGKQFITEHYGSYIADFIKLYGRGDLDLGPNGDAVRHSITSGALNKNNFHEAVAIKGHKIELLEKAFDYIDPFSPDVCHDFRHGLPLALKNRMSAVEIALFEYQREMGIDLYSVLFDDDYTVNGKRFDFNLLFRMSSNGQIIINEEHFKEYMKKDKLLTILDILCSLGSNCFDEYDYEKLGIPRPLFELLVNMAAQKTGTQALEQFIDFVYNHDLTSYFKEDSAKLTDIIKSLYEHLINSNCKELNRFFGELILQLMNNPENYEEKITKIENLFVHNNLPEMAKRFLVYKIMYPNYSNLNFAENTMSPTLTNVPDERKDSIILGDLVRIAAESNNSSLRDYLNVISKGNDLYLLLTNDKIKMDDLSKEDQKTLNKFIKCLQTLYNQSLEGQQKPVSLSEDIVKDLELMNSLFKTTSRYSLPDRIVRMFAFPAGITSFAELQELIDKSRDDADIRGRKYATEGFKVKKGDFLKGIGKVEYLYSILQNGSVAKEFLGAKTPGSDGTPLDTDLTIISSGLTIDSMIENSYSFGYGPIWFILKNDGRYTNTRANSKEASPSKEYGKEVFNTGDEWGIRTGFGSCDIDAIIMETGLTRGEKKDMSPAEIAQKHDSIKKAKFAVALNGFYIPIYEKETGSLIFTPREYDMIRSKMAGLSRYGVKEYEFSPNLDDVPDYNNEAIINDAVTKRTAINNVIKNAMDSIGLRFSPEQSEDLTLGGVDLIDTGSTGRGTNADLSSDFDFIMRIDVKQNQEEIGKAICDTLGLDFQSEVEQGHILGNGNLRLKEVKLPGLSTPVDIDVSYVRKDELDFYSTDACLKDRLETIRKQDPVKYQRVLDNIIYAKQFMKESGCYKPSHAPNSEGGMGGVGVENWVLQNGGSFTDACRSFLAAAMPKGKRIVPFEEFKKNYQVYDFGQNFYGKGFDEFVSDNMTEEGYKKMAAACAKHLKHVVPKDKEYTEVEKEEYQESILPPGDSRK